MMDPGPERLLQAWEGYVVASDGQGILVRFVDLTAGETSETEEARIPWTALSGREPGNVPDGTYLRWRIFGGPNGQGRSEIEFDIAGVWTAEELGRAKRRGAELANGLRFE